jgi:micrococcal nuclease
MILKYLTLTAALLLIQVGSVYANNTKLFTGTVISVRDGDTIKANFGSKKVTIRLACIDAPEMKQTPWGKQSADRLKQLLPVGQSIKLRTVAIDKYKRTVGEIYIGNTSINLTMVQEGQAVIYKEYLSGCIDTKDKFLELENIAKTKKLGFWNQVKPVMPWDFRKSKKAVSTPVKQSTQKQCDPSYPDFCLPPNSPDLDCGDIPYRRFTVKQPDPHGFDRDNDGIGCERN